MKCTRLQIALFWKDVMERPDTFANRINAYMSGIFDEMPQIINLPNEMPYDIPRVQFSNKDKTIQLSVSKLRCDFIINFNVVKHKNIGGTISDIHNIVIDFINAAFDGSKEDYVRIGVILTAFDECSNPVSQITDKYFCFSSPGMEELSFRMNKIDKVGNYRMNNILDVSAGKFINDILGIQEDGIIIQRDINNEPTDDIIQIKTAKEIWKYATGFFTEKKMGEVL